MTIVEQLEEALLLLEEMIPWCEDAARWSEENYDHEVAYAEGWRMRAAAIGVVSAGATNAMGPFPVIARYRGGHEEPVVSYVKGVLRQLDQAGIK